MIARAQELLAGLGYDPGPVDGLAGPRTAQAVRAFQAAAGLPVTGAVDQTLVSILLLATVFAEALPPRSTFVLATSGSGFFLDRNGLVLTNAHVVSGCDQLRIATEVGRDSIAEITAIDEWNDLAVLHTQFTPRAWATLAVDPPVLGQDVIAAGFPLADLLGGSITVTFGNVSSRQGLRGDTSMFRITAPVQPGNSGGPVLDPYGQVVGVVTSVLRPRLLNEGLFVPQNVNFAISTSTVQGFLQANGTRYDTENHNIALTVEDRARLAEDITVMVNCYEAN